MTTPPVPDSSAEGTAPRGAETPAETPPAAPHTNLPLALGVFVPTAVIVLGFTIITLIAPEAMSAGIGAVQSAIVSTFGWWYVLIAFLFVVFCVYLGFSRKGNVKLGRTEDEPEFSLMSWFALLFAAGMGIGLVFFGITEPLTHFASPKPSVGAENLPEADLAQDALARTFLHWGLQPWAIYVIVGLALAHAIHRRGRPLSVRWALEPLIGEKATRGIWGTIVDIVALVGTVFGVATSLGLGVIQMSAGLEGLGVFPKDSKYLQYILIAAITCCVLWSVLSGVSRGMKWLSNTNLVMAGVLVLLVLFLGPTEFLFKEIVQASGHYLQNYIGLSTDTSAFTGQDGTDWQAAWSTFYWGWWISWSPFVGVFIARISRGRTVRDFILGVMGVPTLITFIWFGVLGGTAIYNEMAKPDGYVSAIGKDGSVDANTALFQVLEQLPGGVILVVGAILLSAIFFITSSDSGSLVMAMIATGGDTEPRRWIRVFFALASAVLAAALLLGGGLTALQTLAITTALPFSVIMVLICAATFIALQRNVKRTEKLQQEALVADLEERLGVDASDDAVPARPISADSWWAGLSDPHRQALAERVVSAAEDLPDERRQRLFGGIGRRPGNDDGPGPHA